MQSKLRKTQEVTRKDGELSKTGLDEKIREM